MIRSAAGGYCAGIPAMGGMGGGIGGTPMMGAPAGRGGGGLGMPNLSALTNLTRRAGSFAGVSCASWWAT
jgi:hypothetical protein